MTRKPTICKPDLTYHTYSRCINQENMMKEEKVKELMIIVLKETLDLFNFELSGFEILPNHFHFVIRTVTGGENISKIMQRIKSVFARRYNKMHGRTGPVWNERYSYKIIEFSKDPEGYLMHLLWYIAYNSYRKNIASDPRNYKFSSINCYLDENFCSKVKITPHNFFINLGKNFKERVNLFLLYEKKYLQDLWCQR